MGSLEAGDLSGAALAAHRIVGIGADGGIFDHRRLNWFAGRWWRRLGGGRTGGEEECGRQ